jgi:hypothetical protein
MALLTISLLGPPAIRHGTAEVLFPTRKTLALLVYLRRNRPSTRGSG